MAKQAAKSSSFSWCGCLWVCLLVTALVLGVAAIWLLAGRHLRIEERMEEVSREQSRIEEMVDRLWLGVWQFVFVTFYYVLLKESSEIRNQDLTLRRT